MIAKQIGIARDHALYSLILIRPILKITTCKMYWQMMSERN